MTVDTFWSVLGLLATGIAAVGAIGSWMSARHSSAAATAVARIEQDRRHVELTPQFELNCRVTYGDGAMLWLAFTGPPGLDHLDAVTIAIRDDKHDREPIVAGGPTAEEIAQVVWGPYRFVPHVNGADRFGRAVAPMCLNRGDWTQRVLERTTAPLWADNAYWRRQYAEKPVRLKIACHRKGNKPWMIPVEIEVEQGDERSRSGSTYCALVGTDTDPATVASLVVPLTSSARSGRSARHTRRPLALSQQRNSRPAQSCRRP